MFGLFIAWTVVTIISLALQYTLRPKVQKRGPGELQAPVCEQGYPIAYVAGCAKIRGSNVIWKGKTTAKGKHDDQIFDYYADMQLAICQGPVDRIRRMWIGQDSVLGGKLVYTRGVGFTTHNIVGKTSVITANVPTHPPGDKAVVGNQDAHLGDVLIGGPSAHADEWYLADLLTPESWVPPNSWFLVYRAVKVLRAGTMVDCYTWSMVKPNLNDTINIDGVYKRWDGAQWVAESAQTHPAKQEIAVSFKSKDKGLNVKGNIRWYEGSADQPPDSYLQAFARGGGVTPSYGGLCYAVLMPYTGFWSISGVSFGMSPGFYWGESNGIPEISFEVERIPDPLELGIKASPSYTTAAATDGGDNKCRDANPANVLYEWLTSGSMGIGVGAADIDVASFRDAGRILYAEGLGITMVLDQQTSFDDAKKEVELVTDGTVYQDPRTGLWTYRLVREPVSAANASAWGLETDFYTRTDWLVFDEDDFLGTPEYTRGAAGDVANKISVQYIDRVEGYAQRVVDVQNIAMADEVVAVQNTYNSITSRDLAFRIAQRDMKTVGYPRARLKDTLNKRGWKLSPADCFIVNRDPLGISNMRFRVIDIRYGTPQDGRVEVSVVEDVFGMPDTVYSDPGSGWVDPSTIPPVYPAAVRAWELPYDVTRDGPRVGFAALAARGDENTTGLVLYNAQPFKEVGSISYTPSAILSGNLALEETTASIQVQGVVDFGLFTDEGSNTDGENLLLIDNEVIAFEAIGLNADGSIYLHNCLRGVLDTIPRAHSLGARCWLIRRPPVVRPDKTTLDHVELFQLQATSPGGETELLGSPGFGGWTNSRELRPTVPGKFRVGAAADLPSSLADRVQVGDLAVAWKTRNRIAQAPGVVAQDADTVAPESSQKTRARLIQGADKIFQLLDAGGGVLQIGKSLKIGAANPWATVKGSSFYLANGIGLYPDTPLAPMANGTYFIGVNLVSYTVEMVPYAGKSTVWVDLYSVVFSGSGADKTATVSDLRSPTTLRTTDTAAETDTVTVADMVASASALLPFHHQVVAVRDSLESMEARDTGSIFAAGVGLNMGNLFV